MTDINFFSEKATFDTAPNQGVGHIKIPLSNSF
jgi:hypothetical protein